MEQKDKNIKYNEKKKREREIIKSMRSRGKLLGGGESWPEEWLKSLDWKGLSSAQQRGKKKKMHTKTHDEISKSQG